MRTHSTRLYFIPLFVLWWCSARGQSPAKADPIDILSPKGVNVGQAGVPVFKYSGNVKLRHRGVLLFCDQALHQVNGNQLAAIGHVLIVQGDTIIVKADTLVYEGPNRLAMLRGRVTFQDRRIILNAAQLDYNLTTGIAHYTHKGRLVDSRNVLTSREGYYDTRSRQIELQHAVRLISPDNTLTTEALIYNTTSRLATLVETTRITGKEGVNVAQRGQYDTQEGAFQPTETTAALKFSSTNDSLNYMLALQPVLSGGDLALLTAVDKPLVASQTNATTPGHSPRLGKTALPKTPAKPVMDQTLAVSDKNRQPPNEPLARRDTTYTLPGTVVESLKATSKTKAIAKRPVVAKNAPVNHEVPISAAATLVPTGKPDEQVTLAAPGIGQPMPEKPMEPVVQTPADSVSAPVKPLEMPVRLTGAVILRPVGTTAIRLQATPVIRQKVDLLPPAKQADSIYLAVASAMVLPKPATNTLATGIIKKTLPAVRPLVKPVKPAETSTTGVQTKNTNAPVMATTMDTPKAALPQPSMRQVTNPPSGSGTTFRAAVIVPTKRVNPARARRAAPDLEESDLERELNKKKRTN